MVTARSKISIDDAETLLAAIRSSVLVHVQEGVHSGYLRTPLDSARLLNGILQPIDDENVRTSAEALEVWLTMLVAENDTISHTRTRSLLDQISELEVALIAYRARANGGSLDVGDFVDESFELLRANGSSKSRSEKSITDSEDTSSVDAEILEVFGEEADTLLESIQQNLTILSSIPTDRAALWEIKKSSHTFKGAAGIVGLKKLSELAHRIEDLLGRVSEKNIDPSASQIALLNDAADCLKLLSSGDKPQNIEARLTNLHQQFDTALSTVTTEGSGSPRNDAPELVSEINANAVATNASNRNKSIVRISLDKLDDLVSQVGELIASQSAFKARFHDLERQLDETHNNTLRLKAATLKIEKNHDLTEPGRADNGLELRQGSYEFSESTRDASVISNELKNVKTDLENLYQNECTLIDEIQTRLVRLRNVEFGTITNRLQRTVRVTCDEEEKRAEVVVENGPLEVDTQVIDALIEPLLHLLKNAVVHGIEPAETRRMLGKPEIGKITVRVSNKGAYFVLSVTDDGRGIAFRPLLEKAVTSNLISAADAEDITTDKILELIFLPGLTTAKKLSLNAGRGVGMSIVRESVAAAGGIVSIETWPQKGTTFSIRIPRPFADRNFTDNGIEAKKPIQLPAKKRTTLIVDDSPSVRIMTAKAVENAGWHAETARDGIEALEKLRVIRRPDVILSDIEMPRMGGYEFVAALGGDENLKDIPVIFISSRVNESERAEAVGVIECLTKPYDERKLVDTICRVSATELVMG